MSQQYPGGLITKTPVVPSGPYQDSTASGVWTLDQAAQYVKAGNWPTSGNIDPSAFIENLFSTYLYTGNGSTQTITNGIDLSGKGGLVWMKGRSGATSHFLFDTARGALNEINTNNTDAQDSLANSLTAFNTSGFALGGAAGVNTNATTYVAWTFREQAKFFDVVTYTGNGVAGGRAIAHNLGSTPGCVIVKRTDSTGSWWVWHRSAGDNNDLRLNATDAALSGNVDYVRTATSTTFTVGNDPDVNASGGTYVAYLFAHDAGGFGLTGSDNVISCGSYTGNGSTTGPTVTLGWEPQWLLVRAATTIQDWYIIDTMRGMTNGTSATALLQPNTSNAENVAAGALMQPTATGFNPISGSGRVNASGETYIYIAIRRGPMKVPTSGTQIANPKGLVTLTSGQTVTTGFVTDMTMAKFNGTQEWLLSDRLRNTVLYPNTTDSEGALYGTAGPRPFDVQDGFKTSGISGSYALWGFRRAPGFMDVVCYTGTGVARTINHNLAAVPELMIVKTRSATNAWAVYAQPLGNTGLVYLNWDFAAATGQTLWNSTTPTASTFSVNASATVVNQNNTTYVAYLFATVAGVSKVGSYTGSGTTKQIDCGFTAGARFVLIKRTDSTGNWHLYDSGQGIVAGNDPYFLVNTSDGQYVGSDYVDTYSAGFELSSTAPAGLNANGGTYIFLAIA